MPLQLGKLDVRQVRLSIPWTGAWLADCDIDLSSDAAVPSGAQSLIVGTGTLKGTVIPQGTGRFGETVRVRLLGGGAGWGTQIGPVHHHNDAPSGVTSSLVENAAASAVGETISDPNPATYGTDFMRTALPTRDTAAAVLGGRQWYVDANGITQVQDWPSISMGTDADVLSYDPEQRIATLSADEIVWPGTTLTDLRFGTLTVRSVDQTFTSSGGSRATAYTGDAAGDRLGSLLTAVAGINDPAFLRIYPYRISTQGSDGRLQLQAVTKTEGVPDTLPITVWPGIAGASAKYTLGTLCGVVFLGGDRTNPKVITFDGKAPIELHFDASTSITMTSPTTTATNGGSVDLVAMGSKVDTEIQNIWAALNALQTLFYAGGTAGLPLVTTGIYLPPALPAGPPYVPSSTKGSVLQADK